MYKNRSKWSQCEAVIEAAAWGGALHSISVMSGRGRNDWGGVGPSNCALRRATTPVDGNERAPGLAVFPLCENKYIQSPPSVWNNTPAGGFHWSFDSQLHAQNKTIYIVLKDKASTTSVFSSGGPGWGFKRTSFSWNTLKKEMAQKTVARHFTS